jgi:NAD(P)-dependent dehydrogenase (short-subunit alcohol dehydrogenase family)
MGLLYGKVAVVSGAARGQGRAHAVRLAREGADIIAMDICADIDTVRYPLAGPEDLDETVAHIEQLGRRVAATQTDVRDATAVAAAIDGGVAELGGLDIVVANAGIAMYDAADTMSEHSWRDMIDTNLTGVWTVCRGALPHMIEGGRGGAMVLISSVAAHCRDAAPQPLLRRDGGRRWVDACAGRRAGAAHDPGQHDSSDEREHSDDPQRGDPRSARPGRGAGRPSWRGEGAG